MGKKENNRAEAVRDAVIGYAAVVLGIICFILALVAIIVVVRFVVGFGASASSSAGTTVASTVSSTSGVTGGFQIQEARPEGFSPVGIMEAARHAAYGETLSFADAERSFRESGAGDMMIRSTYPVIPSAEMYLAQAVCVGARQATSRNLLCSSRGGLLGLCPQNGGMGIVRHFPRASQGKGA